MNDRNAHKLLRSALCIIVDTKGSTPRKAGTRMLVFEDGSIEGTIGGGNFEMQVIQDAVAQIRIGKPRLFSHHLLQEHDMCCGGTVQVYIEPVEERRRLTIFGAGHVGRELAGLAARANFEVTLFDDRESCLQAFDPGNVQVVCMPFMQALEQVEFNANTFIAILTYRHDIDRELLRECIGRDWAYLGFIGSQRKILVTRKMLIDEGLATQELLNRVDMPIGAPIGAETPFEIAVSILSRLIEVKNMDTIRSMEQIKDIEQCLKK